MNARRWLRRLGTGTADLGFAAAFMMLMIWPRLVVGQPFVSIYFRTLDLYDVMALAAPPGAAAWLLIRLGPRLIRLSRRELREHWAVTLLQPRDLLVPRVAPPMAILLLPIPLACGYLLFLMPAELSWGGPEAPATLAQGIMCMLFALAALLGFTVRLLRAPGNRPASILGPLLVALAGPMAPLLLFGAAGHVRLGLDFSRWPWPLGFLVVDLALAIYCVRAWRRLLADYFLFDLDPEPIR